MVLRRDTQLGSCWKFAVIAICPIKISTSKFTMIGKHLGEALLSSSLIDNHYHDYQYFFGFKAVAKKILLGKKKVLLLFKRKPLVSTSSSFYESQCSFSSNPIITFCFHLFDSSLYGSNLYSSSLHVRLTVPTVRSVSVIWIW